MAADALLGVAQRQERRAQEDMGVVVWMLDRGDDGRRAAEAVGEEIDAAKAAASDPACDRVDILPERAKAELRQALGSDRPPPSIPEYSTFSTEMPTGAKVDTSRGTVRSASEAVGPPWK